MTKLVIFGASGHGRVIKEAAQSMGKWSDIKFFDDDRGLIKTGAVEGSFNDLLDSKERPDVVLGIGNNKTRIALQNKLKKRGFNTPNIIHPSAVISASAQIGDGSVFFANSVIGSGCEVNEAAIINSGAVVEHDCKLSCGVHVSPGASIAGNVSIGHCTWIGIGASVINNVSIGKNVVVGAGSVVINNLKDNLTAVGVPAKPIKERIIC